jgi:predicted TIM-barrel fold metal-dependent hydrolase
MRTGEAVNLRAAVGVAPTVRTAVDFDVPPGACDCHVHVFDPVQFPYDSRRIYTPPEASIDDLRNLQTAIRFDRLVVVAPSVYGTDNSCTIDAVRKLGAARARGVAVIDDSITTAALDDMAAAGVRGVRLNLESAGDTDAIAAKRTLVSLAERIGDRDWHIQFDTRLSVIAALKDEIAALPVPVVVSHFGRARAALGPGQSGFADLLDLVRCGRVYVKISAPYRTSDGSLDFPDVAPLAQALVAANPDRVLWGSNWPHPGRASTSAAIAPPYANDDGRVLNLLTAWVPGPEVRKKILVDNPARLYRFAAG